MRIWVVGTSGAGKTSLARRLSSALGLPLIELDAINWQPGWGNLNTDDPDEFARRVEAAVAQERWVADGNYGSVRPRILPRATHLIWLDYDRPVIMARVIRRSIGRALDQKELWAGNRETWRDWLRASHPIRWAWNTWRRRRAQYEVLIAGPAQAHLKVLRLRRPRDAAAVEAWLTASPVDTSNQDQDSPAG